MENPFIPEEIVVTILTMNLPADSLARFKCVSKQWCRIISKTLNTRQKLVMNYASEEGNYSFRSVDQKTCEVEDMHIPWKSEQAKLFGHGSCNGLLLMELMDDLFLWNPLIHYHQKIFSYKDLSDYTKVGGLCFDPIKNEYKVVMSLTHTSVDKFAMVGSPKNKSWTRIYFPYKGYSIRSGPVFNKSIHWIVKKDSPVPPFYHIYAIIYFDAKSDEFVELPLPLSWHEEDVIAGLGVLDGCLCMSRSERLYDDTVQVMAMKVYGASESWTVLFRIEGIFFWESFVPLFYSGKKKNEVVIKVKGHNDDDFIIAYDINSNSRSNVTSCYYLDRETVYEATSVRPIGYDWEELDSRGEAFYVENFVSGYMRTMKKDKNGIWYTDKEEGHPNCEDGWEGSSTEEDGDESADDSQ